MWLLLNSYIVEWLEYHLLIGIQHFYLLSNDCDDDDRAAATAALTPYVNVGVVSLSYRFKCADMFQETAYLRTYDRIVSERLARW